MSDYSFAYEIIFFVQKKFGVFWFFFCINTVLTHKKLTEKNFKKFWFVDTCLWCVDVENGVQIYFCCLSE